MSSDGNGVAGDEAQPVSVEVFNSAQELVIAGASTSSLSSDFENRLPRLKSEIEREHLSVLRHQGTALMHAVQAGQLLLSVKSALSKGYFHNWLVTNFQGGQASLSIRTAQRYMRIAENFPEILERLRSLSAATRASRPVTDMALLENVSIRKALGMMSTAGQANPKSITQNKSLAVSECELATPDAIVQASVAFLGSITLDPCASPTNPTHVPAESVWNLENDGLDPNNKWTGKVFVHPPRIGTIDWVQRTVAEYQAKNIESALVMLPAVCDTPEFLELDPFPRVFIRERIPPLTRPYVVAYVGPADRTRLLAQAFQGLGSVFVPWTFNKSRTTS